MSNIDWGRVFDKVLIAPDGCWNWIGAKTRTGYGKLGRDDKTYLVHRYVYHVMAGKLIPDMDIAHLCNNRACCNPFHLEEMDHIYNLVDPTHCPQGHEYTKENTYRPPSGYGKHCRECGRIRQRAYLKRKLNVRV